MVYSLFCVEIYEESIKELPEQIEEDVNGSLTEEE